VTIRKNGTYLVEIQVSKDKTLSLTVVVDVPQLPFELEAENTSEEPEWEGPDGGSLTIQSEGSFILQVENVRFRLAVSLPKDRYHIPPERVLPK